MAALAWEPAPAAPIALPRLSLKAIIPASEPVRGKEGPLGPPFQVFPIAKPKVSARRLFARYGPTAIAASVILLLSIWFGTRPLAVRPDSVNPLAWAKRAIEKRATIRISDTFQAGMKAWGAPKGWAPGWSRHPDGYVRLGQLALFQPASSFTDYRLEFFGQVEDRGMGWAVRARDSRNYYAMKFKVLAGGLRPVLEMVYYPVVGGKPGHQVKVPLSVMVHANTPYHVAVKVSGKRLTASVEGQEVDSWTDEVEPSGAVGFFTEPGERARLYWMKVYKNDDWLGRVCSFLAGNIVDESVQTAWRQPAPSLPRSGNPLPLVPQPSLFGRQGDDLSPGGHQRTGSSGHGTDQERIRPWNS